MEVLKSDNSSTFTLNWGADTSKVDSIRPIVFEGKKWSYDSLWEVSNSGGVVDNGEKVDLAKSYKFNGNPTVIGGSTTQTNLKAGFQQNVDLSFVNLPGVTIELTKVQVYVNGGNNFEVSTKSFDGNRLTFTVNSTLGGEISDEISSIINNGVDPSSPDYVANPFTRSRYGSAWTVEVYFTLQIGSGTPAENYVTLEW